MTTPDLSRRALLAGAAGIVAAGLVPGGANAAPAGPRRTGPYRYPVQPGTPEWARLRTTADKLAATELPDGLPERLSTPDLLATVLAYPLFPTVYTTDNPQAGLLALTAGHNGLRELVNRPDGAAALLEAYRTLDLTIPAGTSLTAAGRRVDLAWRHEALLRLPTVLRGLNPAELDTLLAVGSGQLAAKQRHRDTYGTRHGADTTAELLHGALASRQGSAVAGAVSSGEHIRAVAQAAQAHLAGDRAAAVVPLAITFSYLYTPNSTKVQVFHNTGLTAAQVADYNNAADTLFPNADRETSATNRYNCHSYAWYSTSDSSNSWWMERWWVDTAQGITYPNVSRYWTDGSYTRYTSGTYRSGMKWVYWNALPFPQAGDHSAIEVGTTGRLRSKWGSWGRMNHLPYDVPPQYSTGDIRKYYF